MRISILTLLMLSVSSPAWPKQESPHEVTLWLCDISSAGKASLWRQSEVMARLADRDPGVRLAAVRAVGFIGIKRATDQLVAMLDDEVDWRIVWAAAESLTRLEAEAAVPHLQRVATRHWYPPVRKQAQQARDLLLQHKPWPDEYPERFAFEFFRWEEVRITEPSGGAPFVPKLVPGPDEVGGLEREKILYKPRAAQQEFAPTVAFRVPQGLLLGVDSGEWGGELAFRSSAGDVVLLDENTHALHRTGLGVLALTGLAHLGGNVGAIHRVLVDAQGHPTASLWKTLPGAPDESGFLPNGALFIRCVGGARVIVTADGRLRMAEAADYPVPPELAQPHCKDEDLHEGGVGLGGLVTANPFFVLARERMGPFNGCEVLWTQNDANWLPSINFSFSSGSFHLARDARGGISERLFWFGEAPTLDAARAVLKKRAGDTVDWKVPPTAGRPGAKEGMRQSWTDRQKRFAYSVWTHDSPAVANGMREVAISPIY